jgi:endonuclease YncB( thermonuclease family)
MNRLATAAVLLLLASASAGAQVLSGVGAATDGMTLDLDGKRIRLYGVVAPDLAQHCHRRSSGGERSYPCGLDAKAFLASLLARRTVFCVPESERPGEGLTVAQCFAGGTDISEAVVRGGWALAADRMANVYVSAEADARLAQRGMWVGRFDQPQPR